MNSAQMAPKVARLVAERSGVALTRRASELQAARPIAHRVLANCVAIRYARHGNVGSRCAAGPALYEVPLWMASAWPSTDTALHGRWPQRMTWARLHARGLLRTVERVSCRARGVLPVGQ